MSEPTGPLPEPPGVASRDQTELPVTGDPVVDAALTGVADVRDLPLADRPDAFVVAHRRLHEALTDADAG